MIFLKVAAITILNCLLGEIQNSLSSLSKYTAKLSLQPESSENSLLLASESRNAPKINPDVGSGLKWLPYYW